MGFHKDTQFGRSVNDGEAGIGEALGQPSPKRGSQGFATQRDLAQAQINTRWLARLSRASFSFSFFLLVPDFDSM
jgi:hypothetical protein